VYNGKRLEVTALGIANIGIPGLILIVIVALIIFGPKKLPEIGKAAGETLRAFKTSVSETTSDDEKSEDDQENGKISEATNDQANDK